MRRFSPYAVDASRTAPRLSDRMLGLVGIACLLTVSLAPRPAAAQSTDKVSQEAKLRAAVVQYALANKGKRIGRGECTDLVNAALAHAGAKQLQKQKATPAQLKLGYPEEIYVWGTRYVTLRGAKPQYLPGQIIQFENCYFEKPDRSANWSFPHHTAIIKSANGSQVTLLHQNAPLGGPVTELTLDLKWLQSKNTTSKRSFYARYGPVAK